MRTSDWEQLSEEQQKDVNAVGDRMNRHLTTETEAFYQQHPELQLQWSFTFDVLIRGKHEPLSGRK